MQINSTQETIPEKSVDPAQEHKNQAKIIPKLNAPQEHVTLQNFYYEKVETFQKKISELNRNLVRNQQLIADLEGLFCNLI